MDFRKGPVQKDKRRDSYYRVNYELVAGRWEGFVSIASEAEWNRRTKQSPQNS